MLNDYARTYVILTSYYECIMASKLATYAVSFPSHNCVDAYMLTHITVIKLQKAVAVNYFKLMKLCNF